MTYDLQLRKGGFLITNEWDNCITDYLEQIVDNEETLFHLHDSICLDGNTTLRDMFLLVSKNIDVFSVAVGCPFLDDLIKEALSFQMINKNKNDLGHLELGRVAVLDDGKLYIHTDFSGKGIGETWALEFSPIYELTPYPIVLNEEIIIENEEGGRIFECSMPYTLLEFVKGIVDELSFIGPPDIKAFAFNELKQRSDDVVSNVKSYSFEEVKKKLDEQIEKSKMPCEICGEDARSSHFRKPSTICYKCFCKLKEN